MSSSAHKRKDELSLFLLNRVPVGSRLSVLYQADSTFMADLQRLTVTLDLDVLTLLLLYILLCQKLMVVDLIEACLLVELWVDKC